MPTGEKKKAIGNESKMEIGNPSQYLKRKPKINPWFETGDEFWVFLVTKIHSMIYLKGGFR